MSIRFKCTCGREFAVPDSQAGKKAKCRNCGASILIPRAHRAPGPAPAPVQAPEPQEPAAAVQELWFTPPTPAEQEDVLSGSAEIDNSVIAQMTQPGPRTSGRTSYAVSPPAGFRSKHSGGRWDQRGDDYGYDTPDRVPVGINIAIGLAIAVGVVVAVDAIMTLANSGALSTTNVPVAGRGVRMLHAGWLAAIAVGCVVAVAAAKGSRVCLGILIGGAFQNILINTPLLLVGAYSQLFAEKLSSEAQQTLVIAAVASLVLGFVYVALLLGVPESRRYVAAQRKNITSGAVVGFLSGWVIAVTAIPNPGLAATRAATKPGSMVVVPESWGGTRPPVPVHVARKDPRVEATDRMKTINAAMANYIRRHGRYLPTDLAQLVSPECPAETFVHPASGKATPTVSTATGTFTSPIDFTLVMPGYYLGDLPEERDKLQDFVVCHSDPACCKDDGGAVLRPPGATGDAVRYISKGALEQEVDITKEWMREKPARHKAPAVRPTPTPAAGGTKTTGKPGPTTAAVPVGKRDMTTEARNRLGRISGALAGYVQTHNGSFPTNLAQLISPACPASTFILPGSGKTTPLVKGGQFLAPIDFMYIMPGCNVQDLPDEPEKLRDFVVCHSDPDLDINGASVVLHPPGAEISTRIEVVYKSALDQIVDATRTWMKNNPSRPATGTPKTE